MQALHPLELNQPQRQRLSNLPLRNLKLLRRKLTLRLVESQVRSIHKQLDPLRSLTLRLLRRGGVKYEGSKTGRLEERDGEEELFVCVGFEVGGWGRGGGSEEGFERVEGGFVEAEDFSGVEERAEGGLIWKKGEVLGKERRQRKAGGREQSSPNRPRRLS